MKNVLFDVENVPFEMKSVEFSLETVLIKVEMGNMKLEGNYLLSATGKSGRPLAYCTSIIERRLETKVARNTI